MASLCVSFAKVRETKYDFAEIKLQIQAVISVKNQF
jgi:hypothetical protein